MRVEYIAEDNPDAPLLRLFEFTPIELSNLIAAFAALASRKTASVQLANRPVVTASVSEKDHGLERSTGGTLAWSLTTASWSDVAERARALEGAPSSAFQWLDESGHISVLLSETGTW